jgi:hypothetical protein
VQANPNIHGNKKKKKKRTMMMVGYGEMYDYIQVCGYLFSEPFCVHALS